MFVQGVPGGRGRVAGPFNGFPGLEKGLKKDSAVSPSRRRVWKKIQRLRPAGGGFEKSFSGLSGLEKGLKKVSAASTAWERR